MTQEQQTVLLDVIDGIATITLSRPDQRNAINLAMARSLYSTSFDPRLREVRSIVIRGDQGHLCVGGDLKEFRQAIDLSGHLHEVTLFVHGALARLRSLPAPLLVLAEGTVAGAGMGLVCAGDVVACREGTTFRAGYGLLGLTPDAGTTYGLPRLVGVRAALDFLLLKPVWDARQAHTRGLVSRVFPSDEWNTRVTELAEQLSEPSPAAARDTADLVWSAGSVGYETHLATEASVLTNRSADSQVRERMYLAVR